LVVVAIVGLLIGLLLLACNLGGWTTFGSAK
jgi:hypothetical protein